MNQALKVNGTTDEAILLQAMRGKPINGDVTRITIYDALKGVKSFKPLLDAVNLEVLDIRSPGKIPPLDELAALPKLRTLLLDSAVSISSLAALERFPALKNLEVGKIYPLLDGLKLNLERLQVASTTLNRLEYLRNMNIQWLELGNSVIYTNIGDDTDFSPVKGINQLWLLSRSLTTLRKLRVLEGLYSLWVPANRKLKSIDGLEALKRLEALACYRTGIRDLKPLSGLPLRYLSCGETKIRSLKKIDLSRLIQLALNKTPMKAFDAEPMPELEYLSLESSELERLDELAAFSSLKHLNILNCVKLSDFKPLQKLEKVEILDLQGLAIDRTGIESLMELPVLKAVNLDKTPAAADPGMEALIKEAEKRGIRLFLKEHQYSRFMNERDRRWQLLNYYMSCFRGEDNPWNNLSDKGYHV